MRSCPADLVLHPNLFAFYRCIGNQLLGIQILSVQIHRRNLVVVIGVVIVDAPLGVSAGGVQGDFILALAELFVGNTFDAKGNVFITFNA